VADDLLQQNGRSAGGKLVGDKGMAQIVDSGVFNSGKTEITVNGAANIADVHRVVVFGDKKFAAF